MSAEDGDAHWWCHDWDMVPDLGRHLAEWQISESLKDPALATRDFETLIGKRLGARRGKSLTSKKKREGSEHAMSALIRLPQGSI